MYTKNQVTYHLIGNSIFLSIHVASARHIVLVVPAVQVVLLVPLVLLVPRVLSRHLRRRFRWYQVHPANRPCRHAQAVRGVLVGRTGLINILNGG